MYIMSYSLHYIRPVYSGSTDCRIMMLYFPLFALNPNSGSVDCPLLSLSSCDFCRFQQGCSACVLNVEDIKHILTTSFMLKIITEAHVHCTNKLFFGFMTAFI